MSPHRQPVFRTSTLLALIGLWLILIFGSVAGRADTPNTGFLRLLAKGDQLGGQLVVPTTALAHRLADTMPMAARQRWASHFIENMSVVADGQVCRLTLRAVEGPSDRLTFALSTDCPAHPRRVDAHLSPFGRNKPNYRTLVTWDDRGEVRHAMSTANEACVTFEPRQGESILTALLNSNALAASAPDRKTGADLTRLHSIAEANNLKDEERVNSRR